MNNKCKQCNLDIASKNAKIFCSRSCAATFNNTQRKPRSAESRRKTSDTRKQHIASGAISIAENSKKAASTNRRKRIDYLFNTPFEDLYHQSKRLKIILEQDGKCAHCNNSEWMGKPICFEMDHIDGNNSNNDRSNLEVLCPNCHSNTPTWKGRNTGSNHSKIMRYVEERREMMVENAGAAPARER